MYDFAIIGSGVSGARIAYELTAGGATCLMIEAGKVYDRTNYPPDELGYTGRMFWGGGIEVSQDGRLGFLRGKCLGGTSVVNQADLNRFDDLAWDDWRDRSGIDYFNTPEMSPLYDHLDSRLVSNKIPTEHYNRNAQLFTESFEKCGYGWAPIVRAQSDCKFDKGSDCIVCLGGCPRDSKQSAVVTLIPTAKKQGLKIETEFAVDALDDSGPTVKIHGTQRGQRREVEAARAVLACGSFGNTTLLHRCQEIGRKLPALGTRFACHPQRMTYGIHADTVGSHKGPLQSVESHDDKLRKAGLKLENVFAPPIATSMLLPGVGMQHVELMKKYRYFSGMEVVIRDDPAGELKIDRKGNLIRAKTLTAADRAKVKKGLEIATEMHHAVGAKEVIHCEQEFGLHLMGGCPIGADANTSVVDPDFQVHGHPKLIAADSSIFPSAPGINPSFTIMALSYLASKKLLES
ncbi:Uncharacterized GMC-type oxidoreductase Rv0492c [Durusdinium trenchii]|uniref:Uncharacterized GMC-type oxidoreductase Rv0492c n=1 Tax=Durusdinium trenchii TaxID=1381693 RepID=A0ABP0PRM1_9DINO